MLLNNTTIAVKVGEFFNDLRKVKGLENVSLLSFEELHARTGGNRIQIEVFPGVKLLIDKLTDETTIGNEVKISLRGVPNDRTRSVLNAISKLIKKHHLS